MEVAPAKARRRREQAAKDARVQRWAEDSGNAALMGRELPPAEVLAADQRITAWARQLKRAGLAGDMDVLRAPALTWTCCWARTPGPARTLAAGPGPGRSGPGSPPAAGAAVGARRRAGSPGG